MERIPFEAGAYYHIYNRGTEKRDIFLDNRDYRRFIHYLYVCNDTAPIEKIRNEGKLKGDAGKTPSNSNVRGETSDKTEKPDKREKLVDIVAYALMPNHIHLLLSPKTDTGLSKFMQKVLTGHTMFFNKKHKRTGALYQGLFKSKEVTNEQYLPVLARYIHLNPVDLMPIHDVRGLASDNRRIEAFLKNYRWSSCADYLGAKNFPSLLTPELFWEIFEDKKEHRDFLFEDAEELVEGEDPAIAELGFKE
ncbi:MAG: transposase [Candidatus Paceibacterota bacterium]|jgi:putative transposase